MKQWVKILFLFTGLRIQIYTSQHWKQVGCEISDLRTITDPLKCQDFLVLAQGRTIHVLDLQADSECIVYKREKIQLLSFSFVLVSCYSSSNTIGSTKELVSQCYYEYGYFILICIVLRKLVSLEDFTERENPYCNLQFLC